MKGLKILFLSIISCVIICSELCSVSQTEDLVVTFEKALKLRFENPKESYFLLKSIIGKGDLETSLIIRQVICTLPYIDPILQKEIVSHADYVLSHSIDTFFLGCAYYQKAVLEYLYGYYHESLAYSDISLSFLYEYREDNSIMKRTFELFPHMLKSLNYKNLGELEKAMEEEKICKEILKE